MRSSAFTYVEGLACIAIVLIMAGLTLPNVVREAESRSHRLFRDKLKTWVYAAKSRAIQTRTTVGLSFDKDSENLKTIEEDSQSVSKPFPDLQLPDGVTATKFAADSYESPSDGWRVPFFADGSTTGGGIQFTENNDQYCLIVDAQSGEPNVVDGPLPELSLQSWPAGGLQKRAP
jgi:Tfp pilus assembly protein FimT